jgi:hypothetical protein
MMAPDEIALRADLNKPAFNVGVAEHRWRLISVAWPFVIVAVFASDGTDLAIRFDGSGYPNSITGRLWDPQTNGAPAADRWPLSKGGRVAAVFRRDWKQGSALYLPCDREAIAGHDNWRGLHPEQIWIPSKGITLYLESVHELLHCGDYVPRPRPAA